MATRHAAFQSLLSIAAAGRAPLSYKHADLTGSKAINLQIRYEPIYRIRSTFRTRGIALWDRRRSAFGSFLEPSSFPDWHRQVGRA
jgi:hypothetical protein